MSQLPLQPIILKRSDVDYFWSLAEQPDGSLINSGDLLASDYGEMVFTPDYPGDYLIEVIISQYGDEISTKPFFFNIRR